MSICYHVANNKGQVKTIHLADNPNDALSRFQWSYGYWPASTPVEIVCQHALDFASLPR